MNVDLKSVKLFIRVAALGAIGRAGRDFGYSPTAASQRIQLLEEALGTKLLNRTTRTVSLSADGEKFLAHARKIVDDIEDAVTDLQGSRKTVSGELRVTASASFGRRYVAPFVGEFLRDHPGASVNLELSDGVFDIVQSDYVPKPAAAVYQRFIEVFDIDPASTVMVEDMAKNLVPAAALGMTTVWVRTDTTWGGEGADDGHIDHAIDDLSAWLGNLTGGADD